MVQATSLGYTIERVFARLCATAYMRGFVFHSPRYYDPTEKEAGDVLIWVRDLLILFEIIARDPSATGSTRRFIQRIGKKRDQLVQDFNVYRDQPRSIALRNESGEFVTYDGQLFDTKNFFGIILVDCPEPIAKLHYKTVEKSLNLPFAVAIMTFRDFIDILNEIDTIGDLKFYLFDRVNFARAVFSEVPKVFLDLNGHRERNLMGFYKLHENVFPLEKWNPGEFEGYWDVYQTTYANRIDARNVENAESRIIDQLITVLREHHSPEGYTLVHVWELASLTRRQRASSMSVKINDAFRQLQRGRIQRHFAFYNQATACWDVFYFQYGGTDEDLEQRLQELCDMKLALEMTERGFQHSVLGFGFRKSVLKTGKPFDTISLRVADADPMKPIPDELYERARSYFRGGSPEKIHEFPI